jgi:hypothetical protein
LAARSSASDVAEVSKQLLSRNRLERMRRIDRSQWSRRSSAWNEFAKDMSLPKTWIGQDRITLAAWRLTTQSLAA